MQSLERRTHLLPGRRTFSADSDAPRSPVHVGCFSKVLSTGILRTLVEVLLLPVVSSGDPEVRWRLSEMLIAQDRFEEAETELGAARAGFDELLEKHLLAFADHAAEFYAGSGNNHAQALELARLNVTNRPTRRAVYLMQMIESRRAS
jgi:hypothetical protein